ncbi:MAG: hypothetical protein HW380_955 [Magnetococcales bacterium]|nr:hypothetical protein [Magnetococcales bacterium]
MNWLQGLLRPAGQVAESRPPSGIQKAAPTYYGVHLQLSAKHTTGKAHEDVCDQKGNYTIREDRTYRLTINFQSSSQPTTPGQPLNIREGMTSFRLLVEIPGSRVTIQDGAKDISVADVNQAIDFFLTVPKGIPGGEFKLNISALESPHPDKPGFTQSLVTRSITIDSTRNPDFLERQCRVSIPPSLPNNVAVVHVLQQSEGGVTLQGWNACSTPLSLLSCEKPPEGYSNRFKSFNINSDNVGAHSYAFMAAIIRYSEDALGKFVQWLCKLLEHFPEDLVLVLHDMTLSEIPWEMIVLGDSTTSWPLLGSKAVVTRWLSLSHFGHNRLLTMQKRCLNPGIKAMVYPGLPGKEQHENNLGPHIFSSAAEFFNSFNNPTTNPGLAYLVCHGAFVSQTKERDAMMELGSTGDIVTLNNLEFLSFPGNNHPFFFINACHSARLLHLDGGLGGLSKYLLSKGVDALIGTMGPVLIKVATQLAENFLNEYSSSKETRPAWVLKKLRNDAAMGFPFEEEDKQKWAQFLTTFLYVYLGNPYVCLHLNGATCSEKPGDVTHEPSH